MRERKTMNKQLAGKAEWYDIKRDFQYNFLKEAGLKPENTLLDYGCCNLRGGIPIIKYLDKGNYCGYDVRQVTITDAYKELKDNKLCNKKPIITSNLDDIGDNFDYVFAFSVLIHMSDQELNRFFGFLSTKDFDKCFANVNIGERKILNSWSGFPVIQQPVANYKAIAAAFGINCELVGYLQDLGHPSNVSGANQSMLLFYR
jgi:hypothetical protein